mmetsp:Transcript_13511/g.18693  ORF Transcript_13511/g.18693 Transcript_13511/m.18693 type:complete len:266 (+) Transcript_13511:51-848(+)
MENMITYRGMKRSLDPPSFTVQESTPKKHRRCASEQLYLRNSQKQHGGTYFKRASSNLDGLSFANGLVTPRNPLNGWMSSKQVDQKGRSSFAQSSNPFTVSRKSTRNFRNHRVRRRINISPPSRFTQNSSKFSRPPRSKSSSSFSQPSVGGHMDLDESADDWRRTAVSSSSASYFGTDKSRSPPPLLGRYTPRTPAPTTLPMFTNQRARSRSFQNCPLLFVQSRNNMEEKSAPTTPTVTRRSYQKEFPWKFASPKAKGFPKMEFD